MAKNLVSGTNLAQIRAANFLVKKKKKKALSLTRYHGHVQYEKKLIIHLEQT